MPILFCGMGIGLRVNSDGIPYSVLGGGFAVERVAGFVWARTRAVIIEEINVSNGPESGRNLAAILEPQTASLCHFESLIVGAGQLSPMSSQLGYPFSWSHIRTSQL
jgi:hypothetical protein